MFKRINVTFEPEEILPFMSSIHSNMYGPCLIEYSITNEAEVMNILSRKLSFGIKPTSFLFTKILSPGVDPHIDTVETALNIYLSAGTGDITSFYSPNSEGLRLGEIKVYDKSDLTKIMDFTAIPGECILMNTNVPHDVLMMEDNLSRIMLRMMWKKEKFNDVMNSITVI